MDYSKFINLEEWRPKPEQKKEEEKTDPDIPDWAKPFFETISETEELIKKNGSSARSKNNRPGTAFGKTRNRGRNFARSSRIFKQKKNNKAMKAEKIKISSNDWRISEEQDKITSTISVMNNTMQLWKDEDVRLTDEEINALIQSAFG